MKIINSIHGLFIMQSAVKVFDPQEKFKNKKVAVIGPATSAFEKENGDYIDSFDYVIRINKAPYSWTEKKARFIGNKTDILFHSFYENENSGGGALDIDLYKKRGIRYLINPRTTFAAYRRTFNFFRKYRNKTTVYHLPRPFYEQMTAPFGNWRPTIGYSALFSCLMAECELLYISGFTFFKTPYADGYRDHLKEMDKNIAHIKSHGIHDVELEFELFKQDLEQSKCKKVIFDTQLEQILDSDYATAN